MGSTTAITAVVRTRRRNSQRTIREKMAPSRVWSITVSMDSLIKVAWLLTTVSFTPAGRELLIAGRSLRDLTGGLDGVTPGDLHDVRG